VGDITIDVDLTIGDDDPNPSTGFEHSVEVAQAGPGRFQIDMLEAMFRVDAFEGVVREGERLFVQARYIPTEHPGFPDVVQVNEAFVEAITAPYVQIVLT